MPRRTNPPRRTTKREIEPLMQASRVITAAVVRSLVSVDEQVSVPQLRVLVLLESNQPMNLTSLSSALGVNPSNASRTCDQLVAAGLVDRREDARDRRHVALTLTRPGARLVRSAMTSRRNLLVELVASMTSEDRDRLMEALGPFNEAAASPTNGGSDDGGRHPHLSQWGI